MVKPLLVKTSFRHLRRHPWQTWLTILGIALGVAVVVAVDLANQSAKRSFSLSLQMITGKATHSIVGDAQGIAESFYTELRTQYGLRKSAPIVSGQLLVKGRQYQLLGIDPLADNSIFNSGIGLSEPSGLDLFLKPNRVALSASTATALNLSVGDWVEVTHNSLSSRVQVVALIANDSPLAAQGVFLADIAVAQELLGQPGRLDRINLIFENEVPQALIDRLPANMELHKSEAINQSLTQMTAAFHINLAAMSLLALLVGGFLIYNTITFMVLQRRPMLGTLRALGVTRAQLFTLVLGEAAILGLIGTLAGIVFGILLGQGLVQLVTRTINDIYYSIQVTSFLVTPGSLLKGSILGLATSLVAALLPALEAARSEPVSVQQRSSLHQRIARNLPKLGVLGCLLCGLGIVLAYWLGTSLTAGFVAVALTVLGFSLIIPQCVKALSLLLQGLMNLLPDSLVFRLALRGVTSGLSRTGLAVTALTIAVATTIGVGIMIGSFRSSVDSWLQQSLNSDLYISVKGYAGNSSTPGLPKALIEEIQRHPEVSSIWQNRTTRVDSSSGTLRLMAISEAADNTRGFNLKKGDAALVRKAFFAEKGLLISEPLAFHRNLTVGDQLTLKTIDGEKAFPVLGIFYDYTSSQGLIIMAQSLYQRHWQDQNVSALGLYKTKQADSTQWTDQIRQLVSDYLQGTEPGYQAAETIQVRANSEIRNASLAIFDRTFTITHVLRMLSILVAFIGVLSALMALQLERTSEFALLRATGATPLEVRRIIYIQTGLMGAFAGLLAIPLGYLMSTLLIDIINLRSFGWSMKQQIPVSVIIEGFTLAIIAALLAGIYPSRHCAKLTIAQALREE